MVLLMMEEISRDLATNEFLRRKCCEKVLLRRVTEEMMLQTSKDMNDMSVGRRAAMKR